MVLCIYYLLFILFCVFVNNLHQIKTWWDNMWNVYFRYLKDSNKTELILIKTILGPSFTGYCRIKLWGRTIPHFVDHLFAHGSMASYTGLAGYTVSTQVVNKMQYCSYPEFNMAHSGDN